MKGSIPFPHRHDGIADAVLAVLTTVESSPAAVKYSSKQHQHGGSHGHGTKIENGINGVNGHSKLPLRNQLADLTPGERFSRLCMFLEEQFGDSSITPVENPRIDHLTSRKAAKENESSDSEDDEEALARQREELIASERARLASIGIPVPGLDIKVVLNEGTLVGKLAPGLNRQLARINTHHVVLTGGV